MASLRKYMQTEVNYSYEDFEEEFDSEEQPEELVSDIGNLQGIEEGLEAYTQLLKNSKGLSKTESQSILIGVRMIQKQIGFEDYRCVSMEDYRHNTPREMLRVSMEAVEEAKDGLWKRFKDFLARIWETISSFFKRVWNSISSTIVYLKDRAMLKGTVTLKDVQLKYVTDIDMLTKGDSGYKSDVISITRHLKDIVMYLVYTYRNGDEHGSSGWGIAAFQNLIKNDYKHLNFRIMKTDNGHAVFSQDEELVIGDVTLNIQNVVKTARLFESIKSNIEMVEKNLDSALKDLNAGKQGYLKAEYISDCMGILKFSLGITKLLALGVNELAVISRKAVNQFKGKDKED